jgi:hypothetical protein
MLTDLSDDDAPRRQQQQQQRPDASDGGGGVFGDLARAVGQMKLIDKSLDGEEERLIIATCMADVKTIGSLLGKEGGSFVLDVPLLFSSVVGNPDITRLILKEKKNAAAVSDVSLDVSLVLACSCGHLDVVKRCVR